MLSVSSKLCMCVIVIKDFVQINDNAQCIYRIFYRLCAIYQYVCFNKNKGLVLTSAQNMFTKTSYFLVSILNRNYLNSDKS